jgi:ankyrin repeat protein
MKNKAGAVRLLLAHGSDVNIIDDTMGYTPLMRAAQDGQFEALTALLESGKCNLEIRDEFNMFGTALLVAAAHDHWDCVCKLLDAGANVKVQNIDEKDLLAFVYYADDEIPKKYADRIHAAI